jgi:hypothetical protein
VVPRNLATQRGSYILQVDTREKFVFHSKHRLGIKHVIAIYSILKQIPAEFGKRGGWEGINIKRSQPKKKKL